MENWRATESRQFALLGSGAARRAAISSTSRHMNPFTPSCTISSTAPPASARTGVPHAIASIITSPNGSGHRIGKRSTRASRRSWILPAWSTSPTKSMPGSSRSGRTVLSK